MNIGPWSTFLPTRSNVLRPLQNPSLPPQAPQPHGAHRALRAVYQNSSKTATGLYDPDHHAFGL